MALRAYFFPFEEPRFFCILKFHTGIFHTGLYLIYPAHERAKYRVHHNVAMVSSINLKLSETGMTWILNEVTIPHFTSISLYVIP
jgi:hypothetical protein